MLVGLPGAGKSTLGAAVAERLGIRFVDLDDEIARSAGSPIAELIQRDGEAVFRRCEVEVTARISRIPEPGVIAAGGGWMANQAAVELFRPLARIIYLRSSVAGALARMGARVGERPLLSGADPAAALTGLLEARRRAYESADAELDVEGIGIEELTMRLLALAEGFGIP